MTMFRSDFDDYFFERVPFVDHIIYDTYDKYPNQYSSFFNMKMSKRAYENVLGLVSLGYLRQFGEDEAVTYDKLYQGPKSHYRHIKVGLGIRTSEEAMEDDIDGIFAQGARALGRSAHYSPEILAADVINNGEVVPTGADFEAPRSEALFATDHELPYAFSGLRFSGGEGLDEYSNLGNAEFSITSLRTALNNIGRIPDERGKLVRFTPTTLFGSPEMMWIFVEVLDTAKKSGTADNDINAFQVLFNLTAKGWHYLTDLDAFYLQCKSEHEMNFFWRRHYRIDHDTDFDSGGGKSKITGRFSAGYSGWRGMYASTP